MKREEIRKKEYNKRERQNKYNRFEILFGFGEKEKKEKRKKYW